MLNGHRLDHLQTADVMLDASTTTTSSTTLSETKSGNANMVGRALVGGALLGASGAIVAGATGTKKTSSTSYAVETLNTDLTVRLHFSTGEVAHIIVTHKSAFQWLLSFVGRPPATDDELEKERALAEEEKTRDDLESEARSVLPLELPPDRTWLYTVLIYGAVTLVYFLQAPFHISVRIVIFFICTIVGLPLLESLIGGGYRKARKQAEDMYREEILDYARYRANVGLDQEGARSKVLQARYKKRQTAR